MMAGKFNKDAISNLVQHIPAGSRGAEIGVWYGNTSAHIAPKVKELHLVDPWSIDPYAGDNEHGSHQDYLDRYAFQVGGDTDSAFQAYYDRVYKMVVDAFAEKPHVHIHRMTSDQFFDTFDGELDWIYIDGDHSHQGCLNDLTRSLEVLKPGGLIFGDDYPKKPGVCAAVDEFIANHRFKLTMLGKVQFRLQT